MRFTNVERGAFTSTRMLFILFVCEALIIGMTPIMAFNTGAEEVRAEPEYHTYEEMISEIQKIAANHTSIVQVYNLTTTFEGRTVWAVKVSDDPQINDSTEPDVLFMAGQKANSLISVEMAIYLLNYLTENYGWDRTISDLVDSREIWIIPMANPDGHAYVMNDNEDWLKNWNGTFGVNLERNYGYHWGIDAHSSNEPGDPYYHGSAPFSEAEIKAVRDLVLSQRFVFSLSFSSSNNDGETITYPWGYNTSQTLDDALLSELASDMAMYSGYDVKQNSELFINHGNSDDWLYGNASVLPFTILAGSEDIPQESQIEGIAEENLLSCLYLLDIADNPNRALKAEWTFMVYMSGDNDLEDEGIADLNEMEMIGSDPYVNIIVQFDRASGGDDTNGDWEGTRRYLVIKDYDSNVIHSQLLGDIGEVNMGNPQTLLEFVNWTMTNYPAEHYFLDLWGHGRGWLGVSLDMYGVNDWLNMSEIKSVLPKFKEKIDVVGFDNCNMAMIEVYTQFMGYTDYIVGSEKEEDALGWPYDRIFEALKAEPETSPLELSTAIAKHYVDWARENSTYSATISVVDMSRLPEVINRIDALAKELNRMMALYFDEIDQAIKGTEQYGKPPIPNDLYHFSENIVEKVPNRPIEILAESVMNGLEDLVVIEEHLTKVTDMSVENAHGIAVWLYDGNPMNYAEYKTLDYADITYWDEFLASYKSPPSKPNVDFQLDYILNDTDGEGNEDTLELHYNTNNTGLNISIKVFNNENQHITTHYTNGTEQGMEYHLTFNPDNYSYPSDYYNFYAYLVNDLDVPQNYSEVTEVWLGNQKPEVMILNMTFCRKDGTQVGGDTGKKPIDGENTQIKVYIMNNGSVALSGEKRVKIEFFDGNNLIESIEIDLEIGEEKSVTTLWLARAGKRSIRVAVDSENLIKETNESNNEIEKIIEVKPNIPVNSYTLKGKVHNRENINIVGAKVRIRNMRTNEAINTTTDDNGYRVILDPNWYLEGDMIDVRAEYNSVSDNITVYAYSEDGETTANILLDTEVYDAIFFFKIGLIVFEIIGFLLVIKYYFGMKRQKGGE